MESDYLQNVDYPINDSPLWKTYEKNYDKYFLNYDGDRTPRIPKKIHQVWLGSELPIKYLRLIRTWIDKHPDWDYKLWTDKDVGSFNMTNRTLFNAIKNHGIRSDIFRYEIIYKYGGMYLDTDFKCIKPFDDLMYLDFFTGNGFSEEPKAFPGLLATYAGHPFLKKLINRMGMEIGNLPTEGKYGELMRLGGELYAELFNEYITETDEKIVVFPKNYFYPFPPELRDDAKIQQNRDLSRVHTYVTDRTYAIHLWFTSWQWETQIVDEDDDRYTMKLPPQVPVKKKDFPRVPNEDILTRFLRKIGEG